MLRKKETAYEGRVLVYGKKKIIRSFRKSDYQICKILELALNPSIRSFFEYNHLSTLKAIFFETKETVNRNLTT